MARHHQDDTSISSQPAIREHKAGLNANHLNAQGQTPLTVAQMNKQEAWGWQVGGQVGCVMMGPVGCNYQYNCAYRVYLCLFHPRQSHLFSAIHRDYISPFLAIVGAHLVSNVLKVNIKVY